MMIVPSRVFKFLSCSPTKYVEPHARIRSRSQVREDWCDVCITLQSILDGFNSTSSVAAGGIGSFLDWELSIIVKLALSSTATNRQL
jgi:hypothetical protein